jgi:hypothetical protein
VPNSIYGRHLEALEAGKVRPFVLYSFRHTFLTRLGESGCDAWTLARIAGHSSVAVSARYVNPSEDSAMEAISAAGWAQFWAHRRNAASGIRWRIASKWHTVKQLQPRRGAGVAEQGCLLSSCTG